MAQPQDRPAIYRLRHAVYALELGQHAPNADELLCDPLDEFNEYVLACAGDELAGFVGVTPPGHGRYSIDNTSLGAICRSRWTSDFTRYGC